jgi:homoserine O-acetyltransferase/O-succinyltransferase
MDKPMLTGNFADDLTNPPQLLHLPTRSNYTAVLIPGGPDSYGHMTIAHPAVWATALQSFLQRLPLSVAANVEVRQ